MIHRVVTWTDGTEIFAIEAVSLAGACETHVKAGGSLAYASLVGASLDYAHLVGARLDGADLTGAHFDGTSLVGARLDGARIDEGKIARVIASGFLLRFGWCAFELEGGTTVLQYGCKRFQLDVWDRDLPGLCALHKPTEAAEYEAALRHLLAFVRALPA